MTNSEFNSWLADLSDLFPAMGRYLDRAANPASITSHWREALDAVSEHEARQCVAAMVSGSEDAPKFGDDWATFPGVVLRWCSRTRRYDLPADASAPDPQSYRCIACRDRGIGVEVVNDRWLAAHRNAIEAGLPDDWDIAARVWCRSKSAGPLVYSCDCCCVAFESLPETRRKLPFVKYNPKLHCRVTSGGYPTPAQLQAWLADHPAEVSYEWNP